MTHYNRAGEKKQEIPVVVFAGVRSPAISPQEERKQGQVS